MIEAVGELRRDQKIDQVSRKNGEKHFHPVVDLHFDKTRPVEGLFIFSLNVHTVSELQ
jgi:hypothetical protein